ncbi:dihydroxyacetone kinase phosphoryl donor subunit DhaM [Gracilibacillus sp. YIM 98692]|uniref:dihydroxyacetone kinase phosphoryl donor subunit DhaM n=1 Tax=Gracilibacillus sp. YIM 98692 TaxID=2663532 RepID=UPI0013D1A16C|nr:dihydroxyacetone kinase phosphoryl donor subunit DhaM [Gracilibacillus sp. YIM 98692]
MSGKVGIVIVSHSVKIAEGVYDLIAQVMENVPVATAGGTDDGEIGTSMEKIQQAMKAADQGAGVLFFYDLGSAKMRTEMVLEVNDIENAYIAERVPLVEGTYLAAVESNMGKSIEQIKEAIMKYQLPHM